MATIKSFTSLEQSRKLAEILSLESADMVYFGIHRGMDGKYYLSGTNTEDDVVPIYKNFFIKVFTKTTASDVINNQLPCWSLAALLNILHSKAKDIPSLSGGGYRDGEYISDWCLDYEFEDGDYKKTFADNPVDACVEMIIKLHELNLL